MFEPRLPFEEDNEHSRADIAEEVRLKIAEEVRLKADTTGRDEAAGVRRPHENIGSVRLQPDERSGLQPDLADADARRAAVDPSQNIVLEASAGTGKTRVLVERYVNLLRAGVEPDHILAITFTRKAAAEMRQRIVDRLKEASRTSELDAARWRELRERLGDIAISTIDAFCLSLLREFPLEADVDPGFDLAAETDVPRLVSDSLDQAFRICRAVASDDDDVALVFAQLGERRLRAGIGALLDRRLVAPQALRRFLQSGPRDLNAQRACESAAARLRDVFLGARDGLGRFLDDGPVRHPQFAMLADDIRHLVEMDLRERRAETGQGPRRAEQGPRRAEQAPPLRTRESQAAFRTLVDRVRAYFVTQDGRPRGGKFTGTGFTGEHCGHEDAWRRHRATAAGLAPAVAEAVRAFRRDLNVVLSRGVWRIFAVALSQYQRTLETHALVDFSGVLERSLKLLRDLDEFAETRLRLEARHRHVLLDEFQDTSRAQWELVRQLVKSWGEGFGAADDALPPSIFIVGDRKQSIYGFRDADVAVLSEAAAFIEALRPGGRPRQAISVSFRAAPQILAFVNDLFGEIAKTTPEGRRDRFGYDDRDRFPTADAGDARSPSGAESAVGFIAADTVEGAAELEYSAGSSRAVPLLNRIVKLRPEEPTSHAMLGVLAYRQHDCASAVRHFKASQQVISSQPVALAQYGSCLIDLQRPEDAVAVFQTIQNLRPQDPHARYNLAVVQYSAHQAKDAIATLQPLLQAQPLDPDVLDLASSAYEETGDTPTAATLLRQAIVLDPGKPRYYIDFAAISFNHESFQVGVDMVSAGLKRNPKAAPLYVARGILYIQHSRLHCGGRGWPRWQV